MTKAVTQTTVENTDTNGKKQQKSYKNIFKVTA